MKYFRLLKAWNNLLNYMGSYSLSAIFIWGVLCSYSLSVYNNLRLIDQKKTLVLIAIYFDFPCLENTANFTRLNR